MGAMRTACICMLMHAHGIWKEGAGGKIARGREQKTHISGDELKHEGPDTCSQKLGYADKAHLQHSMTTTKPVNGTVQLATALCMTSALLEWLLASAASMIQPQSKAYKA